jgi:hypothetical protein
MVDLIQQHRLAIADLCRRLGVRKLELFGSAARGDFNRAQSDVDFLFEFDDNSDRLADRFFELLESLEQLLERKVDLVSSRDVSNPYFLQVINSDRVTLYAA